MKNLNTVLKTLTADDVYSLPNRDTLTQTIQMQLSQKQKTFSSFFAGIFKFYIKF